jgi:hypothetical protein
MGNAKPAQRLSRATRTGLRDLPSNAAWLLSKALVPAVSAGEGASKAMSSVGESMSGTASQRRGGRGRFFGRPTEGEGCPAVSYGSGARHRPRPGRLA